MYVLLAQHHMAANSKIYGFEPNLVYQKELSKLNIEKNIYYKNYNVALSDKIGKKTPGSNIRIISEKVSRNINPDYYLVLPWHFKKEILDSK